MLNELALIVIFIVISNVSKCISLVAQVVIPSSLEVQETSFGCLKAMVQREECKIRVVSKRNSQEGEEMKKWQL